MLFGCFDFGATQNGQASDAAVNPLDASDAGAPVNDGETPESSLDASVASEHDAGGAVMDAPSADSVSPGGESGGSPPGPKTLFSGIDNPLGIAVTQQSVCWVASIQPAQLFCGPKQGANAGAPQRLDTQADQSFLSGAFDLALDGTYVYWSNGPNNQVVWKPLAGGAASQYFTGDQRVSFIALSASGVLASDFVSSTDSAPGNIVIGPAADGVTSTLIYPLVPTAAGVAAFGDVVYWGEATALAFGPIAGNVTPTRIASPGGVGGVAVDAQGNAYFQVGNQTIYELAFGSTTPTLLYDAGAAFGDSDIAVDDVSVYWSEHDRGLILSMPK